MKVNPQRIEFGDNSYISAVVIKKPTESQEIINTLIEKLNWLNILKCVASRKDQVERDIQAVTSEINNLEKCCQNENN